MPFDPNKIRARRDELMMTQQEAGVAAGFAERSARVRWHDIESGKTFDPRLSTAMAVAMALRCPIESLVKDSKLIAQALRSASGSAGSKGRP